VPIIAILALLSDERQMAAGEALEAEAVVEAEVEPVVVATAEEMQPDISSLFNI
jgi:hypothetical protein